jgi:hypothetical protein
MNIYMFVTDCPKSAAVYTEYVVTERGENVDVRQRGINNVENILHTLDVYIQENE